MKPTEELKDEHKAVILMMRILEKICQSIESGKEVKQEHLNQIIDFIKIFVDKCHHGKEEGSLFPAMEEIGIPKEGGPIGIMLTDHDMGRSYVRGMSEAISRFKKDKQAPSRFVENARNYIELLTQHIEKEDNILYPMADMRLSKEKQKQLSKEFEKIEIERTGVGVHEKFHKILEDLKSIYLK
jgi:hemerythrin-like domain-containing protein